MANFSGGINGAVNFDTLDLADLTAGTASWDFPTRLRIAVDGSTYTTFDGVGLDFADGRFISGSINMIAAQRPGLTHFVLYDFTMPAATFQSYVDAGDTAGFLATVFVGDDTLSGNTFNDVLDGFAGDDRIDGAAGNDTLRGGSGNDTLGGQAGVDRLIGGNGDDVYRVIEAADVVDETGTTGHDRVVSAGSSFTLGAGVEDLEFELETGSVQGTGNDLANTISGGKYGDKLTGNGGVDTIFGRDGNDTLDGGAQTDYLRGLNGNDSLIGGADDDFVDGGAGTDTLIGGTGNDRYYVDSMDDQIIEAAGAGTDEVHATSSYVLPANVEDIVLLTVPTSSNWNATGNALNNWIVGNSGNNVLSGGGGKDTMSGQGGNDTYIVDSADDFVREGHFAGVWIDHGGLDTVKSSVSFNLTQDGKTVAGIVEELVLTGAAAINGTGNSAANRITGNGAANTLTGLEGNDVLNGAAGADKLIGGIGNDTYQIDNAFDVVIEDGGDKYDAVRSTINVDLNVLGGGQIEDAYLLGTAAINATGNALGNLMMGNSAINKLTGGGGKDSLYGGDGNDTLDGGADSDVLLGGIGDDTYNVGAGDTINEMGGTGTDTAIASVTYSLVMTLGAVEDLTLLMGAGGINGTGNALANLITGNDSNNLLEGLDGKDTLNGGNGNDTVNGGLGDDSLAGFFGDDVYNGGAGTNTLNLGAAGAGNETINHSLTVDAFDNILQFDGDAAGGQDVLNLDALFDSLGVATASRAGRVDLDDRGTAVDVRIDVNGDGTAEYLAATINSASAITIGPDVLLGTL